MLLRGIGGLGDALGFIQFLTTFAGTEECRDCSSVEFFTAVPVSEIALFFLGVLQSFWYLFQRGEGGGVDE